MRITTNVKQDFLKELPDFFHFSKENYEDGIKNQLTILQEKQITTIQSTLVQIFSLRRRKRVLSNIQMAEADI